MDIAAALASDLQEITGGLHRDPTTTAATVSMLTHNLRLAVRSYRGLELTTYLTDVPVTMTSFEPLVRQDDIATSLRLPLDALLDADPRSSLVIYAGRAGALVDLATDLAYALRVSPELVVLDGQREPTTLRSGVSGLAEVSTVNRAIGVLLVSVGDLGDALAALRRKADEAGGDVHAAAAGILHAAQSTRRTDGEDGRQDGHG